MRNFSKNLDAWMRNALVGLPAPLVDTKMRTVSGFSQVEFTFTFTLTFKFYFYFHFHFFIFFVLAAVTAVYWPESLGSCCSWCFSQCAECAANAR